MTFDSTETTKRAELWVNAPADADYHGLVEHLEHLEAAGTIDEYVVYHWGHDLDVSSDRLRSVEDQLAREHVSAFKQWATEHGCTVDGLGEKVTAGVGRMGPEYTAEHLPPVLLAEYVGDDIQRITPCTATGEHVSERLEALDTLDEESDTGITVPTTAPEGPEGPEGTRALSGQESTNRQSRLARLTRWLR